MINIAVCDDDKRYILGIKELLRNYFVNEQIEYKADGFEDGIDLVKHIKAQGSNPYDIIFLDVEMEKMNGIETAKEIRKIDLNVPIVYITNYEDYWRYAYDVHAFQFIIKPLKKDEIFRVLSDFMKLITKDEQSKIMLKTKEGISFFKPSDIYYFYYCKKREIELMTSHGVYMVRENISDIYEKLNKDDFFCTHVSSIVNMLYVNRIENTYDIIMDNGDFIPLARTRKKEFMQKLSEVLAQRLKGERL